MRGISTVIVQRLTQNSCNINSGVYFFFPEQAIYDNVKTF